MTHTRFWCILTFVLSIILTTIFPIPVSAANRLLESCNVNTDCQSNLCVGGTCKLRMGSACTSNNQCGSGDCEDSFCDCGDSYPSRQCATEYGRTNNVDVEQSNWRCIDEDQDPDKARAFLDFCVDTNFADRYPANSNDYVKYPVERKILMGYACNDTDACLSHRGLADVCNETILPSTESNDPWYAPGKKLQICTARYDVGMLVQDVCTQQYGTGEWARVQGSHDLSGIYVCQRSDGWTPTTLEAMQKYTPPRDSGNDGVTTSIFGFDVTINPVDLVQPAPKIGIPGVVFSNISKESNITTDESGASWLNIPFLGEYIAAIYRYSVGLVSLVAVLVLIISGVQIITSAGNSEVISGAKHRITSAIIAIAISAGSYTILYTINPELVNLRNLKILTIPSIALDVPEENDPVVENTPTDSQGNIINTVTNVGGVISGADGPVTKVPTSVSEITEKEFKKDKINGIAVNGWEIWNSLSPEQKNTVLPHLFIKTGTCGAAESEMVKSNIDICGWKNKLMHPTIIPLFQRAQENAQKYGFMLCPGSSYRPLDEETQLWNTGIVARFQTNKTDWKKNEGAIAKPSCIAPHSSGGALDLGLRRIGDTRGYLNTLNAANKMKTKAAADAYYSSLNTENVYAVILQEIMYQSGWVRFCGEQWHFETAITLRYSKWTNREARCVFGPSTWENWIIPIPDEVKQKANSLIPTGVPIFPN